MYLQYTVNKEYIALFYVQRHFLKIADKGEEGQAFTNRINYVSIVFICPKRESCGEETVDGCHFVDFCSTSMDLLS